MKNSKFIRNICVFLLLVFVTFYFLLKDKNIGDIFQIILNVDIKYLLIAILCMVIFISSEGINIRRTLTVLGDKISLLKSIKYAMVGFFFSSITPASTGGNPMQLYFMQKDKLPISHSTLAILIELSSFQFITLLISFFGFFYQYNFLNDSIGNIKYLFILGIVINSLVIGFLLIAVFSDKLIVKIVNLIKKILCLFKYSKTESFCLKMEQQIEEYKKGGEFIKNNKKVLLKILSTTFIQIISYHSIPYWIYLSFGLDSHSILIFLSLQSVLFISVAALPFPGAVGISEGTFMLMFKLLFPTTILSSAMLLSRGISFYLFVLITGIIIAIRFFKGNKEEIIC